MPDYIKTVWEFWKPQVVSGNIFNYVFYLVFGIGIGLLIFRLYRKIKGIKRRDDNNNIQVRK